MSSALVVLAPGFEEIEAITIIDLLRRADISVNVSGLNSDLIEGSHSISIKTDSIFSNVKPEEFDILILPGGQPGTNNLMNDPGVIKAVKDRDQNGQRIAAICAAPTVFLKADIVNNRKLTSYPSEAKKFDKAKYSESSVVKDGHMITSRGVGTAIDFALALISEIKGDVIAEDVAKKILHKNSLF